MSAVVITGIGAVSSLGDGVRALRDALFEGRDGIRRVERFDVAPFAPVCLGGVIPRGLGRSRASEGPVSPTDATCLAWAVRAAREAWEDAGVAESGIAAERIAVVAGTTEGDASDIAGLAIGVARALGATGPAWCVSTACASSANAIGLGRDLILAGDADLVVAGGAEKLVPEMYAGFHALGVLAAEKCAPFGETRGTTLGEGAGFLVLERDGARKTKRVWACLCGYGLGSDAWHETSPDPRGAGIARAMASAIGDAGIAATDVDYVNAHATGTAANDDSEWRGIQSALGARAAAIPVSASKGFLGHAQGAAGVLETIATMVCLAEGRVPQSVRVGAGRPHGPPDLVADAAPRAADVDVALSNSAAFGGADAVVAVSRRVRPMRVSRARVVRLIGAGRVFARDAVPALVADHDVRGTDAAARFFLAASVAALADAGVKVRGALRERAGVFGAAMRLSPETLAEYRLSVDRDGPAKASASAFARLVLHAPTGTASRLLALRGPTTTLAMDGCGGLAVVAYAARWLAGRDDCDVLVAGGVDERDAEKDGDVEEGAACVVLRAGGDDDADAPRVVGVATGGPGALADVETRALAQAGAGPVAERFGGGSLSAPRAAAAVGDALAALRAGTRRVVVSACGQGAAVAIALERG